MSSTGGGIVVHNAVAGEKLPPGAVMVPLDAYERMLDAIKASHPLHHDLLRNLVKAP